MGQKPETGGGEGRFLGINPIFGVSDALFPAYESFDDVEGALFEEHDWLAYSVDAFIKALEALERCSPIYLTGSPAKKCPRLLRRSVRPISCRLVRNRFVKRIPLRYYLLVLLLCLTCKG